MDNTNDIFNPKSNLNDFETNSNIISDIIILNGPLNYIELYNKVTKQKLWLFMDTHKNITMQKKCSEYEAKDVDKFFYKILTEPKIP
jgi:hypothetical protein